MKTSYVYLFSALLSAAMLVGCGGGGGGDSATGTTTATAAEITSDNVDDLAIAATEASKRAVDSNSSAGSIDLSGLIGKTSSDETVAQTIMDKVMSSVREASVDACPGGGSATENFSSDFTSGTITYNDCNDGYGSIISGTATFSGDPNSITTFTYTFDLTVTDVATGQSQPVTGTITCNANGCTENLNTGEASIANSDFSGDDGRNYSFEGDVTVTGDDTSGWNVNATVVDPDHGAITISAENVTFGSCETACQMAAPLPLPAMARLRPLPSVAAAHSV